MFQGVGGGGGGGVGSPLIFCENTILPKILKIFGQQQNLEAQLKIPLNKISAKFSFLATLKISCKNIENGGVGKKCKVHFRKIAN